MRNRKREVIAITWCGLLTAAMTLNASDPAFLREPGQVVTTTYLEKGALRYTAEGREIVMHNGTYFNNRPLYCSPRTEGVVMAGDRPFLRFLAKPYVHGSFSAAIVRDGAGKWFHEYSEVESRYRCGRMTWRITDSTLPEVSVTLDAVPLKDAAGFALRLKVQGQRSGDKLVWAFGGAKSDANPRLNWDPIMRGNPDVCKTGDPRKPELMFGMIPEWCVRNQVKIEGQAFRLGANDHAEQVAIGKSDREGKLQVADASAGARPMTLIESTADKLPMVCEVIDLKAGEDELFWAVEVAPVNAITQTLQIADPAKAFQEGVEYLQKIERVQIETPDPRLDAAVAAVCHPIDAACDRDPVIFRHGSMAFFIPFLGWRVIGGATALGWHDRVKGTGVHYAATQVNDDKDHVQPHSDAARLYCLEGSESRFYGRGRVVPSLPHMYNSQSQFFDQLVRDWRWTADPEMEKVLRPALELHLEWDKDCFDPDDDGLYESYINTLPSDSIWYNGGGSVEESAYAYYGHFAAMDMARRAGDKEAAARHQARAEKIKRGLKDVLWLKDRGHFGLYLEQGGHRRVHSDAWVYSEFLPIDVGITTPEEALQALYFTEWGLERIRLPFGGVLCQPSNWVPSKWFVRDMFGGDILHLALSYFKIGLGDEGWDLLLGATLESAYASAVPGGFSHIGAGTDFSDNSHMFARAVVEGLFGYDPDYPNGAVRMCPAFPSSWPTASIRTPDYTFDYLQEGGVDKYRLTLPREADVHFRLPVRAREIRRVRLNGQEIRWKVEAGFGCTWLLLSAQKSKVAEIAIETIDRLPQAAAVGMKGNVGESVRLVAPRGKIVRWQDFHDIIEGAQADGSTIRGRFAQKPGNHIVLAEVEVGKLPQRQVFKLHVTNPEGEAKLTVRTPREAPKKANWKCLDLTPQYNGDVRTIFQQQYLSPRPKTCSVRLGVDGYSAWTFSYWGNQPPTIDLSNLQKLAHGPGQIMTSQNVPFARFSEDKNIAFTSLWDNWPRSVTVPVNQKADVVWLLVCGSTFPMQTRIANAEVRFNYADGQVEKLELVPPLNFWSLCSWGGMDYSYEVDAFCLPKQPPPTVQLGNNCRAMVLSWKLRPNTKLKDITLETYSQDVVIGLMSATLMTE
ncbi:MAG: DUF4450 domain-containing protein [Verrucomicrobiota bacterium]